MAKYTILFGEYLQTNELPTIFDEITGFSDLFVLKYIDHEIGFETEWLFEQKLLGRANLVIPIYKQRLTALAEMENKLFNRYQITTTEQISGSYVNGATEQKQTILPFNANTAEPNNITETTDTTNTESRTNTRSEDLRPSELKQGLDEIKNTQNFLIEKLLDEFKNLFMAVY
jgi:hypothetical protein